ncbi:MAG: hypothetical protein IKX83_06905 [Clostridia bacterium]|nr:hypothetical protein [Clostridia bacterium]
MTQKEKQWKVVSVAVPWLLCAAVLLLTLFLKVDYHMDEVWSYGLANHPGDIVMDFELNKTYDPREVYDDYLVADPEHRFDYANVWENQRNDNHPPLYYALLHTVCSLFPGTFSKWYGGVLNIAFGLLMFLFVRRLILQLTGDRLLQFWLSIGFALCPGILNAASFLRMYFPAMCWCTILASLALSILEKARERAAAEKKPSSMDTWPLYLSYALVSALGALTHYYCTAFVILLTAVLLLALILYRQVVHAELTLASVLVAALCAYWIFPDMVHHVFAGDRGSESLQNLESEFGYPQRLRYFFGVFSGELFGGFLLPLLLVLAVLIAVALFLHIKQDYVPYLVLFVPVLGFYFLISKAAVYQTDRYVFPVLALIWLLVFCLLLSLARGLIDACEKYFPQFSRKAAALTLASVLCLCVLVPTLNGYRKAQWEYLYRHHTEYLATAEDYTDYDCLCIYHARYQVPTFYREMLHYKSVTFLWDGKVEGIRDLDIADSDHVLVKVIRDDNDGTCLKHAREQFPQFTKSRDLFTFWAGTTTELLP